MTTLRVGSLDIGFLIHAHGFSARLGPMDWETVSWKRVLFLFARILTVTTNSNSARVAPPVLSHEFGTAFCG
jgi:hypothetical protein